MKYTRDIYPALEKEFSQKEVTVITGMRRVGKTTAMMHLHDLEVSENKVVFDLENPIHRRVFEEKDYDLVWKNLANYGLNNDQKAFVFIDEAQFLPEVTRVVKYLYDHYEVKFVLTGSSSYYLKNLFPESLAGRKVVLEMYPLRFGEFLRFKKISRLEHVGVGDMAKGKNVVSHTRLLGYYQEYMDFGGFPGVVLEQDVQRKTVLLSEIFTSYFEKDAKGLADFRDMSKLRDLILLLVSRVGSKFDVAKLASSLSLTRPTVYSYLSFLEQTYFISMLPKHSGSVDRQAAGSKKLYFCDSGLMNVLGKVSQGQLLEQSVFQNLRSKYELEYFSSKSGAEIDFVLDSKTGLEVKLSASARDIGNTNKRATSAGLDKSYVVSLEYSDKGEVVIATDL